MGKRAAKIQITSDNPECPSDESNSDFENEINDNNSLKRNQNVKFIL